MAPPSKSIKEIFADKVHKTPTCWLWTGAMSSQGYGKLGGRVQKKDLAHRAMLKLIGVPLPKGMVVDHICMNRICVNPEHLRVVTKAVNAVENSTSMAARNKSKTHCKRGHAFTKENTREIPKNKNWRECKKCRKLHSIRYVEKTRLNRSSGKTEHMA